MIRRLFARLHQFWFDGTGDDDAETDEIFRAIRFMRHVAKRTGIMEDPHVRHEFAEAERDARALRRERQRR